MAEPEISVVVATRDRRELLSRCLESFRRQSADPATFEVVVADDGSVDGTAAAARAIETRFALRVLELPGGGQAAAQNAAFATAAGRVVLIVDDDVVAGADLVAEHAAAHRAERDLIGVGHLEQRPRAGRDWYARAFARSWNRHYDELAGRRIDWSACFGANLSVPREALAKVGGFATDLPGGEDMELAFRLEGAGLTPRFLPRARAVHDDQKGRPRLLADLRRQGAGQVALAARHPEMTATLLGWFGATSRREVAVRRLLLALRVPPEGLARLGRLLPGEGRKEVWFHLVSRLAFWRAVRGATGRELWERLTIGVPVLMYHAFGERDEGDRYVVSRRALSRQLRLLSLLGYRGVPYEEVVRCIRDGVPPPRRAVAITIDDGYLDNLEVAWPLLRRRGFPATIFLVSGKLGGVNDWTEDGALAGRPLLTPEQAVELAAEGVTIGAHTRSHPVLSDLADGEVEAEIIGSRADLDRLLGAPVLSFAYPFGRFDERAVEAVGAAGMSACTVAPRLASLRDDPRRVPRVEVRAGDSLLRFLLNVWLGAA